LIKLSNGVKLPKLGLGTFRMTDEEETKAVILNAIEVGYRHFDTAQMYNNEAFLGEAFRESNLKREEFFITTKLKYHHPKEETRKLLDQSLKDLQTEYIDLLLIHWPNHDDKVNIATWEVFEEYYEKGLVRAIGVSNFTRFQLENLINNVKIKPMVNQVEFHPGLSQINMIEYLSKHNIKLMGYAPLMAGHMNDDRYKETLESVASEHNVSVPEILIAWGLAKGAIMIPKTVTKSRLISNLNAKDIKLTKDNIAAIDKLNTGRRYHSDPANNVYGKFVL